MQDQLARLRRFNRLLTERIGVVDDRYLGTSLPFVHARLLYELGQLAPLATHHLRRLLTIDRALLSRGLAALEATRLVRRSVDPRDARLRIVELTAAGRRQLATLDRRTERMLGTVLDPLGAEARRRLLDALDDARRLLLGAVLRTEVRPERDPDVAACQAAYLAEIARRFGRPLDPWNQGPVHADVSLLVLDGARPVGTGALRTIGAGAGEIKRMWLHPDTRGLGLGARLLDALELAARAAGNRTIRLDTNGRLREAIALYERAGYRRIERYNDNPDATHFYAKRLTAARANLSGFLASS